MSPTKADMELLTAVEELLRALDASNQQGVLPLTELTLMETVIGRPSMLTVCIHCRLDVTTDVDPTAETAKCPVCTLRKTADATRMLLASRERK